MNQNKARRGIAMLAVLVVLLLLTVLASGFFMQARDSSTLSTISATQTTALGNAELGLQEAVRRLRAAQISPLDILTCTTADVDNNMCPGTFSVGPVWGTGTDLMNGGGLLYRFIVYRRPLLADPNLPTNRYVVRVTGFFGADLNSESLITNVLEAEVDIGVAGRVNCLNGYEC
jgi:type II secretory pathway pseudopilin PulG